MATRSVIVRLEAEVAGFVAGMGRAGRATVMGFSKGRIVETIFTSMSTGRGLRQPNQMSFSESGLQPMRLVPQRWPQLRK